MRLGFHVDSKYTVSVTSKKHVHGEENLNIVPNCVTSLIDDLL